jgi:hypothetical protein
LETELNAEEAVRNTTDETSKVKNLFFINKFLIFLQSKDLRDKLTENRRQKHLSPKFASEKPNQAAKPQRVRTPRNAKAAVKDESKTSTTTATTTSAGDDAKQSRSPDFVTPKSSPTRQPGPVDESRNAELPEDPTMSVDSNPRHESMDAIERDMIEKMTANIAKVEAVFGKPLFLTHFFKMIFAEKDDEEIDEILYGDGKKNADENRSEQNKDGEK